MLANYQKSLRTASAAMVALFTSQGPASAQDPAGAATLGAALAVDLNKAQDLIRQAREAGNDLALQAGITLQNTITSAQVAYEKSLDKTMDKLNDQQRKVFTDIDSQIKRLMKEGNKVAADVMVQARLAAAGLPLSPKYPMLGAQSPSYAVPGREKLTVTFDGTFKYAYNGKVTPDLAIGETRVKARSWDTLKVTFDVPSALLGKPEAKAVAVRDAKLHIPWDDSGILIKRVGDGVYPVTLALLPQTPGKLVLSHEETTQVPQEDTRRSPDFFFDSSSDDHEENRSLHLSEEDMRAGWRIRGNTCRFELRRHIEGDEGHDWYNKGYQGGSDVEAVWRARTEHKSWGNSGKIIWGIACQVLRSVPRTAMVDEAVPLAWGMSRVFKYPAGKWKAVWTRFDGNTKELIASDLSSAFLQIDATGDQLTLTTYGH